MKADVLISVITPVFNESQYLPLMLESLIRQDHDEWEAVLVDDGSTDDTVEIARQWSLRDPRIRLVDPEGKLGKVAAFNRAFAESRGELVCHVGGDDTIPEGGLRIRVESLMGADARSVAFGKLQFVDAQGTPVGSPIPRGDHGSQSSPGATYTRALADLIFPNPETLPSEDIWLGNAARACGEVVHHTHTVTNYRRHSLNSNPRHKPFDEMSRAIADRMRAYELLLESDLPLPEAARVEFRHRLASEELRRDGRVVRLLSHRGTSPVDRAALASMSSPLLWRLRQRLGVRASGWRRR